MLPAVTATAFTVAVVALSAAGVGIIGSRVFNKYAGALMVEGVAASVVALTLGWNQSSWWGLALDALLVGAFGAARNSGVLPAVVVPIIRGRVRKAIGVAGEVVACALVTYVAVSAVMWPWHRHWGTTAAERHMELPGDNKARNLNYELMHAVTIEAPPEEVWRWLVQLGQDRAGFYSYDWLERIFLADVHNVYEIRPEWQQRAGGDFIRATPRNFLGGALALTSAGGSDTSSPDVRWCWRTGAHSCWNRRGRTGRASSFARRLAHQMHLCGVLV
jgi:hypothetical protein